MFLVNCISIGVIILIAIFSFIGYSRYGNLSEEKGLKAKLMPLGLLILEVVSYSYNTHYDQRIQQQLTKLHGRREAKERYRFYLGEKIGLAIFVIGCFALVTVLSSINNLMSREAIDAEGGFVRSESDRSSAVSLTIQSEKEKLSEEVEISIPKVEETLEEKRAKLDIASKAIKTGLEKMTEVRNSLSFPKQYGDVMLRWSTSDIGILSEKGRYNDKDIAEEGKDLTIKVLLIYKEEQMEIAHEIRVYPIPEKSLTAAAIISSIKEEMKSGNYNTPDRVQLPETYEADKEVKIKWKSVEIESGITFLIFGVMIAVTVFFLSDEDLKKTKKEKDFLIQVKFPDMIAKYVLLINAGMTIQNAWKKICLDYIKTKEKTGAEHPLYEEMVLVLSDLKGGVSESEAYEKMGRRVQVKEIRQFTNTLSTSLKRGNSDLTKRLTQMSTDAWEIRVATAKRLGEEAGTKLLFPMVIMLIVVVGITIYPAFMSFKM